MRQKSNGLYSILVKGLKMNVIEFINTQKNLYDTCKPTVEEDCCKGT